MALTHMVVSNVASNFCLQLRGTATALSRKCLHDLTTVRRFTTFFFNMHNKKTVVARKKFGVRGSISVTAPPSTRAA
jgi:hypothetical protein